MASTRMREIVRIDEEKCDGCGLCIPSCAEGAIQIIDGKARLIADNLCDGLGNCLGVCPQGAITIERRPADAFDEDAVRQHTEAVHTPGATPTLGPAPAPRPAPDARPVAAQSPCGCPGAAMRRLAAREEAPLRASTTPVAPSEGRRPSRLGHWPVQLHLLPIQGPLWEDAEVVIAADCVGFAMPDFQERFLSQDKTLAVGCPKLDDIEAYVGKLTTIFQRNRVRSVTVIRMEVPCCSGLVAAVKQALAAAVDIPMREVIVSVRGESLSQDPV